MTPEQAATKLQSQFRRFPWFVSVGTGQLSDGETAIFLYVKSARHHELRALESGWMGYKVLVRPSGSMRPLGSPEVVSYS
jgi:hypothetical protein